jgi:putative two-component system response regulator
MKPLEQSEVLVVDDQKSMRKLAMLYLCKPGFRCIHGSPDGATTKTLVSGRQYDLVVLDWKLGDTKGPDVLKLIRASRLNKTMAVLIATGENKLSNIQSAMSAGASNDIKRPYSDVASRSRLERALMCKLAAGWAACAGSPGKRRVPKGSRHHVTGMQHGSRQL